MSPETLLGIALVVLFTAGAAAMISRTLPALIVLPIMGFAIAAAAWAITGELTSHDVLEGVVSEGAISLHKAMIVTFFGGALSFVMQRSGVAEQLVKQGAELVGADPLAVGVFSLLLVALLFSSLTGLGAVIMVSMIVLPMLSTVGLSPAAGAGIVLFGMSLGGVVNPANWVIYVETLGVPIEDVQRFALALFAIVTLGGVAMILVELFRGRLIRLDARTSVILLGFLGVIGGVALWQSGWGSSGAPDLEADAGDSALLLWSRRIVLAGFVLLLLRMLVDLVRRASRWRHQTATIRGWAYLIPVVPLIAILLFDVPILAAFAIGFVYAILATARPGSLALSVQCLIEGGASVMPAIILMIGIGILIAAVKGPADWAATHTGSPWPVLAAIEPILEKLVPSSPLGYVLGFGLAAPLALYRGPLNVWGLGFGVATILLGAQSLPAAAIMAMLLSVGQVQGICDPTNTANVWIAHHQGVDVNALMLRTLPFVWGGVFIGLALSAAWFL
ncbi:Citrate transporter [Planctomycetes bacterium Poly30]|uniref:Citrate transporter n=1 Tax=Saltatorellus ferox TaxID=2528018 RepID=A0A518ERQ1_9BACT|nr:Citrate transporter [Planctomycetes bacterium Poly30]